jgi:uncharacterized protein (TIGR03086 family)
MDDMRKGDLLEAVLNRTQAVVAGVPVGAAGDPTPCPKWPVETLTRHMLGWAEAFGHIVSTGGPIAGNPDDVEVTDAAGQYRAAADALVGAWRSSDGPDGQFKIMGDDPMPGTFLYPMMLGELIGHGWDLAKATGQPLDWPEEAATLAHESMSAMIQPSMREGDDAFVGPEVEVPDDAPPLEKLVAFAGRDPGWTPPKG